MSWSPKQQAVIEAIVDDATEVLVVSGPVQCGKSASVTGGFLGWASWGFAGQDFIIASRTNRQLAGAVVKYARRFADTQGVSFERKGEPYILRSARGRPNQFYPLLGTDVASADKARSFSGQGALCDEGTLLPDEFRDSVEDRLSQDGAMVVYATNPAGPQHPMRVQLLEEAHTEGSGVVWIDFELADNPGLSAKYLRRLEKRYTGAHYQRMVKGLWVASEGQIYPVVPVRKMTSDPAYFVLGVDWGHTGTTAAALVAYHHDGTADVCGEWVWNGSDQGQLDETEQAARIADHFAATNLHRVWVDPTATGLGVALAQELDCPVRAADNDVDDGIQLVRRRLETDRLFIDKDAAPNLWGQLNRYQYDDRYGDRPLKGQGDDDGPDAIRYAVWSEAGTGGMPRIYRRRTAA